MSWHLVVVRSAAKELSRAPRRDAERLVAALEAMSADPFSGDVVQLKGRGSLDFRRRVGSWRILFSLDTEAHRIEVTAILRRTTTTY
jgi:mRNA-degrading endonuclease RelE of RelBE toxin-antitoxin system